jgi:nucleoside-diphosphate-sugar epimerase
VNRILVTGASGFVGFHLAKSLSESSENEVYLVDNQIRSFIDLDFENLLQKKNIIYLPGDLCDDNFVRTLPEVDIVFHLAAYNGTQNFYTVPWYVFDNSLSPTLHLLKRYANSQDTKFIYTGTSESYSDAVTFGLAKIPTAEDVGIFFKDLKNPRWSYGFAKTAGEVAIHACASQFGTNFQIIRLHNLYGPRMGFEHVIPDLTRKQLLGDGTILGADQSRSFLHVFDAIRMLISLSQTLGAYGLTINIGSPQETTISQLAKLLAIQTGYAGSFTDIGAPEGSVSRRVPDLVRLSSFLDISNLIGLESGIVNTVEYIRSHHN